MWINVSLLDCDDMTVKPLLTAQRLWLDYDSCTEHTLASCYFHIHGAPRVSGFGDEQGVFFLSRDVLFVAVALLGAARGVIQQSSGNFFPGRKS